MLYVLYLLIFTVLERKTLKFYLIHLKITLNLLHVNINIIFMKNNYFPKQKLSENKAVLYIFTHLFNAWLKRTQLNSGNCFCVPSVVIRCFG